VDKDGTVTDAVTDFYNPISPGFDSNNNMFITSYRRNLISKISPNGDSITFASGLDGPAGLIVNDDDEVFVTLPGANFSGNGQTVLKFLPDGTSEDYITGNGLLRPIGITLDEFKNIYVANYNGGSLFKVDTDRNITELANIPGAQINQITYSKGYVYIPSPNHRKIYRVNVNSGLVEHFAGSGGTTIIDSTLLESSFNFPNSAAVSPDGDSLYILDRNVGRIRLIDLNEIVSSNLENTPPDRFFLDQNYPNPFNPNTTIRFSLPQQSMVKLELFDILGSRITQLVSGEFAAGMHEINFNGNDFTSGIYFYRIEAGDFVSTKKLILVK
jgi:sugar lactone lactonase YvrE